WTVCATVDNVFVKGIQEKERNSVKRFQTLWLTGLVLLAACGYNTIQTLDEQVNAAASQIKVQLQRRADLVPNLVETVKGYAKQEQTVFIAVAEARAKLAGAVQSGDLQQMAQANAALTAPLGRLLAIAESYPQLKSNENFRALQDQLEGTENRIAVARHDYNVSVATALPPSRWVRRACPTPREALFRTGAAADHGGGARLCAFGCGCGPISEGEAYAPFQQSRAASRRGSPQSRRRHGRRRRRP